MKPHVTELLELLNKPALLKWANKIGLEGIKLEDYRKKSLRDGSSLHTQIEEKLKYDVPIQDDILKKNFENFISKCEVVGIEQKVETNYFEGRYDLKMRRDGKIYICDFKSQDGIYIENILQLTAYRMSEGDCNIAIVKIPECIFKPLTIDFAPYEEIIKALSIIWQNKRLIK